jgi:Transglutaminase-like superfamily
MTPGKITNKASRLIVKALHKTVVAPGEALLICRMAWWVSVLSIAVRLRPLPRALGMISNAGEQVRNSTTYDSTVAEKLARTIDQLLSVDMLMFKPICWKRAAILHRYLSLNGIASRILFGVRNDPTGQVTGHAWVESDGNPVVEFQPLDYVVTYTFPSNGPCNTELALLSTEQK